MLRKYTVLNDALYAYLVEHNRAPDPVLAALRARTEALGPTAAMATTVEQGQLLTMLAQLCGARQAIEVGTFTGISTLCIARGLAEGGRLRTCDHEPASVEIAREFVELAGMGARVEFHLEAALAWLQNLETAPEIDLAFVDADKTGYEAYFEELLPRLRPGGLLIFDNTLWDKRVIDARDRSAGTEAIRRLNVELRDDPRVDTVLLPVADGMTLVRKR